MGFNWGSVIHGVRMLQEPGKADGARTPCMGCWYNVKTLRWLEGGWLMWRISLRSGGCLVIHDGLCTKPNMIYCALISKDIHWMFYYILMYWHALNVLICIPCINARRLYIPKIKSRLPFFLVRPIEVDNNHHPENRLYFQLTWCQRTAVWFFRAQLNSDFH